MKAPPMIKAKAPKMGPADGVAEGPVKSLPMQAGKKAGMPMKKKKPTAMASMAKNMAGDIGGGY